MTLGTHTIKGIPGIHSRDEIVFSTQNSDTKKDTNHSIFYLASLVAQTVKQLPTMWESRATWKIFTNFLYSIMVAFLGIWLKKKRKLMRLPGQIQN